MSYLLHTKKIKTIIIFFFFFAIVLCNPRNAFWISQSFISALRFDTTSISISFCFLHILVHVSMHRYTIITNIYYKVSWLQYAHGSSYAMFIHKTSLMILWLIGVVVTGKESTYFVKILCKIHGGNLMRICRYFWSETDNVERGKTIVLLAFSLDCI